MFMKIAALIATLLIGSSTLALAQPGIEPGLGYGRGHGPVVTTKADNCPPAPTPAPVVYQPIRYQPARPNWTALTQPERMVAGQIVHVGKAKGQLNTLELKAVAGQSFVKTISIGFAGGGSQVVQLNRILDLRNPTITIDLAGTNRVIKNIEVYGSGKTHSAYQMFAV